MAIEIQPEKAQGHGGGDPGAPRPARPWWLRPAIHTAIAGAVIGYLVGHWLGGLGVFNDLLRQMAGRPVGSGADVEATSGLARYFRYSLDHKVVGLQYLVGM